MKNANIAPEIKNDELFNKIVELVKSRRPKTILEIGSANGTGSTQAFIKGIEDGKVNTKLCCIESVLPRFNALKKNTEKFDYVNCIRASSVPTSQLMTPEQIDKFLKENKSFNIKQFSPEMVKRWREEDIEEVRNNDAPENGIEIAKKYVGSDVFDMVLIDGSAFTGYAELIAVLGSNIIILDDTMDIKNWDSFRKLSKRKEYKLIAENKKLRNGYAIFEKV